MNKKLLVSIIIPTYNGASRIGRCLDALKNQTPARDVEIIVVNDGSTDNTAEVIQTQYLSVRLLNQKNAGPAVARNRGASEATGSIIMFTDDDCEPAPAWMDAMLQPFSDPEVVGTKGAYRTRQTQVMARFVQTEYEDKYRLMAQHANIDFIDTYSAAFRRDNFQEMNGYDTAFPVACAEDIELSYRMSARGWKMKFVPGAIVYHQHPDSFLRYIKKKFKFAFWRVLAVRKNPHKALKDTHTPQLMKLQMLFGPALPGCAALDLIFKPAIPISVVIIAAFLMTCMPFSLRVAKKDPVVGAISPGVLAARSCAQFLGVASGIIGAKQKQFGIK
jgi:glycosyltransferase involved in cell wall biosynthesis